MPYLIAYSASKFALDGFFGGLREELMMQNRPVSVTMCIIGLIGEPIITCLEILVIQQFSGVCRSIVSLDLKYLIRCYT